MQLDLLKSAPDGVEEARALADGLDRCLAVGLSRLGAAESEALAALAGAFSGTPLASVVGDAAQALSRGEVRDHHLVALAAARASLMGAVHDALLAQGAAALGLTVAEPPSELQAPRKPTGAAANLLDGALQWLMEVAVAGFAQLEAGTVAPVFRTLEALEAEPELARAAALLTGFATELLEAAPTATHPIPRARWGDLWTRAVLATRTLPAHAGEAVSGTLAVLGADLRHHDQLASAVVHGVLSAGDQAPRLVRLTLSAWKVDALTPHEVWTLLAERAPELVEAVLSPGVLSITEMTLLPSGDLLWTGKARRDGDALPWDADVTGVIAALPPMDRHPVQIALPVVGPLQIAEDDVGFTATLAGSALPLDTQTLSRLAGLPTAEDLSGATAGSLLLRWDDGWRLQPLLVATKKALLGPPATVPKKKDLSSLQVLRERAGKLLRSS